MKKFIILALLVIVAIGAQAQLVNMLNATNTYSLANLNAAASTAMVDTVANTGTGVLTSKLQNKAGYSTVTIQVVVTKVSGTVGGTISLKGSIDGTNFVALKTEDTQTALATITAADASGTYHWRLAKNHFTYYQVSWAGTGTMNATFTAQALFH